jgi:hypothetical protein
MISISIKPRILESLSASGYRAQWRKLCLGKLEQPFRRPGPGRLRGRGSLRRVRTCLELPSVLVLKLFCGFLKQKYRSRMLGWKVSTGSLVRLLHYAPKTLLNIEVSCW